MEENTSKVYVGAHTPLDTMTPGAGSALFVINLCASIAPVDTKGRNIPGLENYRLYQVARVEDGRTRHRLRLGFFTSESHAESVLTVVRQQYPTAFTACLCDEDRRFTRGFLPESASAAAPAPKRPVAVVTNPAPAASLKAAAPQKAATLKSSAAPQAPAAAPAAKTAPHITKAKAESAPKQAAPKAKAPVQDVVEVSWKPESSGKMKAAPASAAAKPPAEAALDDFTWEPPALQSAADGMGATAKHPVLSPVHKTQPVIKAPAPAKVAPASRANQSAAPKADTAASMRIKALDLTLSDPPAPTPQKAAAGTHQPFHVGKGVDVGDLQISLQAEPSKASSQKGSSPAAPRVSAPIAPRTAAAAPVNTSKTAPASLKTPPSLKAPALSPDLRLPDLDSTQTIRALTSAELNDDSQEKWFAIQLAASEQPVNLDTMPHLDIFEAYRLYSVAIAGSGKIVHSLRLGFFKEAVSAEAVSGYLKTFFSAPTVLRISVAEHARFKDAPTALPRAGTDESRTPAKVVELSDARAARPVVPTVTMEVPTPRTNATGSFRMSETGSFKPNDTGSFKSGATGAFRTGASGAHKVLTPALKPAAKSAGVATKRSELVSRKTSTTGKYKTLPKKSLSEQLLDEAREVELSQSGIRKLPKNNSLLSKLVGKLTK